MLAGFATCGLIFRSAAQAPVVGHAVVHVFDAAEAPIKDDVRAIACTPSGNLVVGSNHLAVFDGDRWAKIATPNTYAFRALAAAVAPLERVWVGAIDHVGFIERTADGDWSYTSVPTGTLQPIRPIGDIWSVHAVSESGSGASDPGAASVVPAAAPRHGAVWIASQQVLRWDGERLEAWTLPSTTRLAGFSAGDRALIYQAGRGLLQVGLRGEPTLLVADRDLPAKPVTWILPLVDGDEPPSSMMVGLRDVAYRWNGADEWLSLAHLSAALKEKVATTAVALDDQRIAVATFDAGIVVASRSGDFLARISTREGLSDDSVYALAAVNGRLFAGLPSGLVRIDGAGDAAVFDREAQLAHGTPRRVLAHDRATFVLASKGLYRASERSAATQAALQPVVQHGSPLWDAASAAGHLWLGGLGGIWRVAGETTTQELHATTDVLRLAPSARVPEGVIFTEGYQLKSLTPSPHGGWAAHALHASVSDTPVSLLEDADGAIWVSTVKDGIARFRWRNGSGDDPPALELETSYRPHRALPPDTTRPNLAIIGGRLYALAEERALRLESDGQFHAVPGFENDSMVAGVELARAAGAASEALWLAHAPNLATLGVYAVFRTRGGSAEFEPVEVPGLDTLGALARIDCTAEAGQPVVWISGARGLLRIAESSLRAASPPPTVALVVRPRDAGRVFHFPAAAAVRGEPVFYQTRLEGAESDWGAPAREAHREFSQLAPGNYTFHARALDRFGRAGMVASHAFVIIAPWWRQPPAYAAYGVLLALSVAGAARWRIRRLKHQNDRLNRLVSERTRELELSNTAKSEFLENISHEIRNPLNGLGGLLELMKEETLAPRERELAKSLKTVAGTLTRVFEDVLEFSKLEYGYAKLHLAPFSLRRALEEVVELFALPAQGQHCPVRIDWPPELADGFVGDEARIKTIVGNFLGNALKYAPGAPIEIRASATEEKNGLVDLYLDVTDHGPGIPPEEQGLIFKKFVRGSDAKRKEISGTGLGLATCHVLARLMNGNVGVESTPGQGATFSLRLLLPRTDLPVSPPAPASAPPHAIERALIVDDESYNRTVLEGVALELGFQADTAGNASEAMRRLHACDYAVVFMDWELPGPKGGDLAKFIRARAGGDRPIILATTAHDSDEMQNRCRAAGMDGFLRKPFNAEKIRRALAAVRDASAKREGSDGAPDPRGRADFWSEQKIGDGATAPLNLAAFAHYERARPDDPAGARGNYLAALDAQTSALTQALHANAPRTVADIAHRLRALAGLIGAAELNVNARRLEEFARAGDTARVSHQAHAVFDACALLKERLEVDHPAPAST